MCFTRPVFPLPVTPGWKEALGFPLSFAPRRYRHRTSGAGTGIRTLIRGQHIAPSFVAFPLNVCDFVSHFEAVEAAFHDVAPLVGLTVEGRWAAAPGRLAGPVVAWSARSGMVCADAAVPQPGPDRL